LYLQQVWDFFYDREPADSASSNLALKKLPSDLAGGVLCQARQVEMRRYSRLSAIRLRYPNAPTKYWLAIFLFLLVGTHRTEAISPVDRLGQEVRTQSTDLAALTDLLDKQLGANRLAQAAITLSEIDRTLAEHDVRRVPIAQLLVRHNAYGLAVSEFETLHRADPKSYEFSYDLALAYHRAGQNSRASTFLQDLLATNESAELEDLMGEIEQSRGAMAGALTAFRRATELNPKSEDYRLHYGQALVNQGNLRDAVGVFAAAAKDLPQSAQVWMAWGGTLYLLGRFEESAQKLLHAAEIAPQNPRVYFLLGRAYDAAGSRRDVILLQFERYLSQGPRDAWAEYFYGKILAERAAQGSSQDLDKAQLHVERALALDSTLSEAHAELGSILDTRGHLDAAKRELEEATRLDRSSSIAYYRLAHVYRELGQNDKAREAIEKFNQLKRKNSVQPK